MKTTTDLSAFGYTELNEAKELITALESSGTPNDFQDDEISIMLNQYSGYVFLTNSDHQVAMLNDGKLESFYYCSYCGQAGFFEEIEDHSEDKECLQFIKDIKETR